MSVSNLPLLSSEAGFLKYLQEIKKFPSLEADEEYMLAKSLIEHNDLNSAHKLVTSHLKLVAKIAYSFRGYGLPIVELVSEGNMGLMRAVKLFNPELGFRLSTYAVWWIKAAIQEYILKTWSLVKIGTTAAQKKLFFNLGKVKRKLKALDPTGSNLSHISTIASELNVTEKEVTEMSSRMSGMDVSLNSAINDEDNQVEAIDLVRETRANQEVTFANNQEAEQKRSLFKQAMSKLNERERHIITERHLNETPSTLEYLSQLYNISRERIRQIEAKAFEKLRKSVQMQDA